MLGSAQAATDVDAAACARADVAIGRRGTGGGAVLCDEGLLEVDVALPHDHPLATADVTEAYAWLGALWAEALAGLGVATRLVAVAEARAQPEERRAAARLACWAGISPYEVLAADGRKLVGLAQRRRRGAILHQAAIACSGAPARVAGLLTVPDALADPLAAALAATTSLDLLAGADATPAATWERLRPLLAARLAAA